MQAVLYGYDGSGSAAIEAALALTNMPYRVVQAASWDPKSALDELRQVNPLLQIPTLVFPDGTTMSESAAILIELGLRDGTNALLPHEPKARALAIRGLVYIAANCYSAIGVLDYPERYCEPSDDDSSARIRKGTRARLHAMWDSFADQFPLTPEEPGALDVLATVVSKWSGARAHLKQSRPSFIAQIEAIEQHPAIAPIFKRHWP